jgi:hypothetical protein
MSDLHKISAKLDRFLTQQTAAAAARAARIAAEPIEI